jgi:hypothetical protein
MPKKRISGTDFEIHLYPTIRKNFPLKEGWAILENKSIEVGKSFIKPDFVVKKRKIYAVIDAKDKAILEPRDIDKILDDKKKTKAKKAIIYIANDTEVPLTVEDYALGYAVKIQRTTWRIPI